MSSLDSQLYERWLYEEAASERNKRQADVCSHHRRVQLILLDAWRQATQFVCSPLAQPITPTIVCRLPLPVINQFADRSIMSYWATRPFNKNAVKQTDTNYRRESLVEQILFVHEFRPLVSYSQCIDWSRMREARARQQMVKPSSPSFSAVTCRCRPKTERGHSSRVTVTVEILSPARSTCSQ